MVKCEKTVKPMTQLKVTYKSTSKAKETSTRKLAQVPHDTLAS